MRSIHEAPADLADRTRIRTRLVLALEGADPWKSLAFHRLGGNDRGTTRREGRFDKVFRGAHGPARVTITAHPSERGQVIVELESSEQDHDALVRMAPEIVGIADRGELVIPEGADPKRVLRDARLRARGLRLVRVPWLYELLVLVVIQQRVAHPDAMASHRFLLRRHGTPYSEGDPTLLFPSPLALSRMSPEAFRDAGIDRERAERLRTVGRLAKHLPRIAAMPFAEARATLAKVPGLGPWTVEHFLGAGLADADAVPTADYWYPHTVAYALAGQERADDARMLELLEPFRPQRYRVLLWLMAAGVGPVRHGPRMKRPGPPR